MTNSKLIPTGGATKPPFIWINVLFFLLTFLVAAIGVPFYQMQYGFSWALIVVAFLCLSFCELSITAGYHRLWSHRAYEANGIVKVICAIGGAFAMQNSILHWSSDHRVHHKHVDDNSKDPYSAKMGFWYSHIGWMLRAYQAHRYRDYTNVEDLQKDSIVMWQHRHYFKLALLTNLGIPFLCGLWFDQMLASFLLVGFFRLVLSHHLTFLINSLAHIWGRQPYSDQNTAKDNAIVAFLTFGEGYHNFHHHFQYDYRNAIKWWQFDPTKWLIKLLSYVGWTSQLKKVSEEKIVKAVLTQQMNETKSKLMKLSIPDREELLTNLQQEYDQILIRMHEFYQARKQWVDVKRGKLKESVEKRLQLESRYETMKQSWLEQQRHWQAIVLQFA